MTALAFLLDRFDELPATTALAAGLPAPGARLGLAGLPGSSSAVLVATLARRGQRVFVVIAPSPAEAERWSADLRALLDDGVALYPQRESLGADESHYEIAGERVEALQALLAGRLRIVVTTARASAERTGVPRVLEASRLEIGAGPGAGSLTHVIGRLERMGFARVPTVTEVAQFAVRGGILDVYGFGMAAAARLEWWGDEVVSLRSFDLDTQRSGEAIERVTVLPVKAEGGETGEAGRVLTSLLELLPADSLLVLDGEGPLGQEVERAWAGAEHQVEVARRLGEEPPSREALLLAPEAWRGVAARFGRLVPGAAGAELRFPLAPPEAIDRDLKRLRQVVAGAPPTVILCDNEGQVERLDELLEHTPATLVVGALDGGFVLPSLRVLTDHEVFRRARRLRRPRRYRVALAGPAA
ncbi:MAG: hypothetical protein ACREMR_05670, partial [Gemmatimonadales bacterium]